METDTNDLYAAIEIKSANQWVREARRKPVPKMLFGELWLEGELSVMFGDTGAGKSILATGIAESVARGRSIDPFDVTARPQKILYIDFELSSKQFEMRYSADHEPAKGEFLRRPYRFSERFQRIELKADILPRPGDGRFETDLKHMFKTLLEKAGANVLIIDNISHLKRTADDTRGWAAVLKELKSLTEESGISILMLADTVKRSATRGIVAGDVQCARAVANYADNIFAIGRGRSDASLRYIKHVRPRSCEPVYGAEHVPTFRMAKTSGNFLGFEFRGFAPEGELLRNTGGEQDWQLIEKVKSLSETGLSIRQIAAELGISKSTVHRYLHMPTSPPYEGGVAAASADGVVLSDPDDEFDPTTHVHYFPGCEEYEDEMDDPRFDNMFEREDEEAHLLRRESYLIEAARARARKIYNSTGVAPPLAADPAYSEFMESLCSGKTFAKPTDALFNLEPDEIKDPDCETTDPQPALKRSLDSYGHEILVEKEDPNGKPRIWYKVDSNGTKFRHERKGFAVIGERV